MKLDHLVEAGQLVYPPEVIAEFERGKNPSSPDPVFDWVKKHKATATCHGQQYEMLKTVLAHPQVRFVLDPDKTGVEEADAHVLALALALKDKTKVIVLTEETQDRPSKISMTTACGLLELVRLPMLAFLEQQEIWSA